MVVLLFLGLFSLSRFRIQVSFLTIDRPLLLRFLEATLGFPGFAVSFFLAVQNTFATQSTF